MSAATARPQAVTITPAGTWQAKKAITDANSQPMNLGLPWPEAR